MNYLIGICIAHVRSPDPPLGLLCPKSVLNVLYDDSQS